MTTFKSRDLGPPEQLQWDVADTRVQFPAGVSVLNIDWGDVAPSPTIPKLQFIIGRPVLACCPAATRYWDYTQGAWVDKGQSGPVHCFWRLDYWVAAGSEVKEAALNFASFMARPELVKKLAVTADTGIILPASASLMIPSLWVNAGFDQAGAEDYLDAVLNSINHPNAVLDLRIRGSAEYLNVLDVEISRALAGEISSQAALDNVAKSWNEITDRLGRDGQLEQYRNSVGFTKK